MSMRFIYEGPIVFEYMICLCIAIWNPNSFNILILCINKLSLSMYPLVFYSIISLSLSPKGGRGMLAKESSQVTALRYRTMLSSSSLFVFLSQLTHNSHHTHNLYIPPRDNSMAQNVVQKMQRFLHD